MLENEEDICQACQGHGYRVEVSPGSTVNATTALMLGIKGERRPCSCGQTKLSCQTADAVRKEPEKMNRFGQPITADDISKIRDLMQQRLTHRQIAEEIGRTERAVRDIIRKRGIKIQIAKAA